MWQVIKSSFTKFGEDRCSTLAASLAYYTIFAMPPLLFILVTILTLSIGWYYGEGEAREQVFEIVQQQISTLIGNQAAEEQIGEIMRSNAQDTGLGWKSLLSLVGVIFGATGAVAALQTALNLVWHIKADSEKSGLKDFFFKRLLSLGMILGLGLILLVSFVIGSVLQSMMERFGENLSFNPQIASAANFTVTFVILTVVFGAIFKFMPDAQIAWHDVWIGALVTAVLFTIGRLVLSTYLSYADPGQELGSAAASLAVILVWVYYSSMIILLGAEFTKAWVQHSGRRLIPEPGAVKFVEQIVND